MRSRKNLTNKHAMLTFIVGEINCFYWIIFLFQATTEECCLSLFAASITAFNNKNTTTAFWLGKKFMNFIFISHNDMLLVP
mmetsp:Transcript_25684/g.75878  ORF Transcript_25684/g.75878 Transcript_25684/m.75878 type:complete len:81 (-) Transcript_25684:286-528(-)